MNLLLKITNPIQIFNYGKCDYDFEAHKEFVPMQPGGVPVTYADTSALEADFDFNPSILLRDGLRKFAE